MEGGKAAYRYGRGSPLREGHGQAMSCLPLKA